MHIYLLLLDDSRSRCPSSPDSAFPNVKYFDDNLPRISATPAPSLSINVMFASVQFVFPLTRLIPGAGTGEITAPADRGFVLRFVLQIPPTDCSAETRSGACVCASAFAQTVWLSFFFFLVLLLVSPSSYARRNLDEDLIVIPHCLFELEASCASCDSE